MKRFHIYTLSLLLGCTSSIYSQTPQSTPEVQHGSPSHSLLWDSVDGRTYFIQMSLDLQSWTFFTPIISGDGTTKGYGFSSTDDKMFLRLWYTDTATTDPALHDFDGDGISSADELEATPQSNPLRLDSDNDGIDDGGLLDRDGDGIPSAYEIANGLDPLVANGIADLLNYLGSLTTTSSSLEVFTPLK